MADDDEVAVCTECHSDQPDQYILKNPFFHQGGEIPCRYCSGRVVIVSREKRKNVLKSEDTRRGV